MVRYLMICTLSLTGCYLGARQGDVISDGHIPASQVVEMPSLERFPQIDVGGQPYGCSRYQSKLFCCGGSAEEERCFLATEGQIKVIMTRGQLQKIVEQEESERIAQEEREAKRQEEARRAALKEECRVPRKRSASIPRT